MAYFLAGVAVGQPSSPAPRQPLASAAVRNLRRAPMWLSSSSRVSFAYLRAQTRLMALDSETYDRLATLEVDLSAFPARADAAFPAPPAYPPRCSPTPRAARPHHAPRRTPWTLHVPQPAAWTPSSHCQCHRRCHRRHRRCPCHCRSSLPHTSPPRCGQQDCEFFSLALHCRPWRLEAVLRSLYSLGLFGVNVTEIRGAGRQAGTSERARGQSFDGEGFSPFAGGAEDARATATLVDKCRVEVVTVRGQVDDAARALCAAAATGEHGDGKLFVSPVADVIRVRTAEQGAAADRMAGGLGDRRRTAGGAT